MQFTIRQLEIFKAVAESGHVTHSCEGLGISQSAVSMAIQELEMNLNTQLFERRNRKLIINESGRLLFDKTQKLLAELKELEGAFLENKISGSLVVGASMTIGEYMMPNIVFDFMQQNPGCKLELKIANTKEITDGLMAGEIDVSFIEGIVQNDKIELKSWKQDELAVIASNKQLYGKKSYRLEELYDKNWVLRESGSGTRAIFHKFLGEKFSNLNIFFTLGNTEAIKKIISQSDCLTCLSKLTVEKELAEGTLFEVPLDGYKFKRELNYAIYKEKYQSKLLKEFVDFVYNYKV
jgi:DNA-binding transcriptional LysR family regulator